MKKTLLVAGALAALATPAMARGCGGYVNLAVWGCAPWDNNPPKAGVTPGYKPPAPKPTPVAQPAKPVVLPTTGSRLVTDNGAGVIARDGASKPGLISNNQNGLVSDRGGALVGNDGASRRGR